MRIAKGTKRRYSFTANLLTRAYNEARQMFEQDIHVHSL